MMALMLGIAMMVLAMLSGYLSNIGLVMVIPFVKDIISLFASNMRILVPASVFMIAWEFRKEFVVPMALAGLTFVIMYFGGM